MMLVGARAMKCFMEPDGPECAKAKKTKKKGPIQRTAEEIALLRAERAKKRAQRGTPPHVDGSPPQRAN